MPDKLIMIFLVAVAGVAPKNQYNAAELGGSSNCANQVFGSVVKSSCAA
jgi:hypothetical protein